MFTVSLGTQPVVGWVRIAAQSDGTGVVYLHGWGRSKSDALPLLDVLPKGTTVFVPDLPGFGDTDVPGSPWGAGEYANCLVDAISDFASRYETSDIVVVGHSFGGKVALVLAAKNVVAQLVGIVLVGAPILRPMDAPSPSARYRLWRALFRLKLVSSARFEQIRDSHGSSDYRNSSGVMREVFVRVVNEEHGDEMRAVTLPVEMVAGSTDTAAPLEYARRAAALNPLVHLVTLEGVGHMIALTRPNAVADAVRAVRERGSEHCS